MKYRFATLWIALAAVFWCSLGKAETVDVSAGLEEAIGEQISFLQEQASPLNLSKALKAHTAGQFQTSQRPILNFGIGAKPVWLEFKAMNPEATSLLRRISVKTSWIDKVDIYFLRNGQLLENYQTGDSHPYTQRPIDDRFFVFDHAFAAGTTTVLMRVETPDPMVIPVYISDIEETQASNTLEGYSYGFVYGVLFGLLAYNFMLFLSLKNTRYLFYSIYLSCFIIANMSYTGHGFQWLWPDYPRWQLWSNPVLMMAYVISGLVFATRFLETKQHFPRLHRAVLGGSLVFASLLALSIITGSHAIALILAFFFVVVFSPTMVFLGAISVFAGIKFAKYFLIASISAVIGAAITALTVWGYIPYSVWAYRAVDIGMLIDAILLAFALADQFRVSQAEKTRAEILAKIDPLTGLNNRRAFYDYVTPIWHNSVRKNHNMSVMLLDIDRFKKINDTHGHALGDEILILTADTIKSAARRGDITARWGGEEFIIFLPETNLSEAASMAERLRENIEQLYMENEGTQISFTASFGVAFWDIKDISLDDLISIADAQLYLAKELGRNRVCSLPPD